jgi:hypothetical protein
MDAIIADMAKKAERDKKVSMVKPVTRHHGNKKDPASTTAGRLSRTDIAEGHLASEKIMNRPTKDFSTEELGALMQTAPGGAEQNQIRTRGRQFNRVSNDLHISSGVSDRVNARGARRPMSQQTPKIDPED